MPKLSMEVHSPQECRDEIVVYLKAQRDHEFRMARMSPVEKSKRVARGQVIDSLIRDIESIEIIFVP